MDRSRSFRHTLAARWLPLLGLAVPFVAAALAGCGADVVADGVGGNGDGGPMGEGGTCATCAVPAAEAFLAAAPQGGANWRSAAKPELSTLGVPERAALAEAWARDGLAEHAAVASFGRLALDLLAAGAPAELVAEAHRAALDDVGHARLCFALASAYAGEPLVPGPFDFGRGVAVEADLASLAQRTLVEGCVGETLAAVHAVEQLAVAEDPAVRVVLETLARDEARHAELAWRALAWMVANGGDRVRSAVREALDTWVFTASDAPADPALHAHGRLEGIASRKARERGLRDVVLPCARALLAGGSGTHPAHVPTRTTHAPPPIASAA